MLTVSVYVYASCIFLSRALQADCMGAFLSQIMIYTPGLLQATNCPFRRSYVRYGIPIIIDNHHDD